MNDAHHENQIPVKGITLFSRNEYININNNPKLVLFMILLEDFLANVNKLSHIEDNSFKTQLFIAPKK